MLFLLQLIVDALKSAEQVIPMIMKMAILSIQLIGICARLSGTFLCIQGPSARPQAAEHMIVTLVLK